MMVSRFEALRHDMRQAVRSLRRNPGYVATVVVSLALGMGASVAAFGVIDAVRLRALPFPHASRIRGASARGDRERVDGASLVGRAGPDRSHRACGHGAGKAGVDDRGWVGIVADDRASQSGLLLAEPGPELYRPWVQAPSAFPSFVVATSGNMGATRGHIVALVLRQVAALVAVGLVIGIPAARATSRLIEGLLTRTSATDPMVYAMVAVAVLLAAVLAGAVPLIHALRVQPLEALRTERGS